MHTSKHNQTASRSFGFRWATAIMTAAIICAINTNAVNASPPGRENTAKVEKAQGKDHAGINWQATDQLGTTDQANWTIALTQTGNNAPTAFIGTGDSWTANATIEANVFSPGATNNKMIYGGVGVQGFEKAIWSGNTVTLATFNVAPNYLAWTTQSPPAFTVTAAIGNHEEAIIGTVNRSKSGNTAETATASNPPRNHPAFAVVFGSGKEADFFTGVPAGWHSLVM